jgi:toxin ParE1/3/4
MTPRIVRRAEARQDLVEHFVFIGQDSIDAADRFLAAADSAFEQLAQMPEMGSPREFRNPYLVGIRQWRIPGFEKYLIFYRPIADGIEILRVLHGARDIRRILEQ